MPKAKNGAQIRAAVEKARTAAREGRCKAALVYLTAASARAGMVVGRPENVHGEFGGELIRVRELIAKHCFRQGGR